MEGSALQRFEFDGDALDVQRKGNDVYVSVKRVCEALGIDNGGQQVKLAEKEWATVEIISTVAEDGKQRQMTMLHLDSLPLWLATIDAGRVAEDARPKLLRYQKECARVLADHFLGRRSQSPHLRGSTKASLPALLRAIKERVFTPDEVRPTFGLAPLAPSIQAVKAPLDLDRALSELDLVDGMTTADVLAELTKAGYVYVISNIGSFGENVFKIGMTRRLEPMDRVRELGDASVPFAFDVHAMVYDEDAPALESELHRHFADRSVNLVNMRKEFFNVGIDEIEAFAKERKLKMAVTRLAEAREFRETLAIRAKRNHQMEAPTAEFPSSL
jgi:hypothetical protein